MSIDTSIVLNAQARVAKGGNAAGRLRREGFIPVTVYGGGEDAASAAINRRELGAVVRKHGRHAIFTLNLGAGSSPVKIAYMQLDPVKSNVVHMDLQRISLTERSEFQVDLKIIGEPVGVKVGDGILDIPTHTIRIRCLPGDLPEHFDVDVSGMELGHHFRVGDLKLDAEKFQVVTDSDTIIANVVAQAAEVVTEGAAAEPEVAKKGKDDKK
jgi:large subunit ribosomal protein L25